MISAGRPMNSYPVDTLHESNPTLVYGTGINAVKIQKIGRFWVVRDDETLGGTKTRYVRGRMYDLVELGATEFVTYGNPWDKDCFTVAACAREVMGMGARVRMFYPSKLEKHPRQVIAQRLGAVMHAVLPANMNAVRDAASEYADTHPGAVLIDCNGNDAVEAISASARGIDVAALHITEVWCAINHGTTFKALAAAYPNTQVIGVLTGPSFTSELPNIKIARSELKQGMREPAHTPFNSCAHFDAKAYQKARLRCGARPLFWNSIGDTK